MDKQIPTEPEKTLLELWLEAQGALKGFVFLHMPNRDLAEDIVQEVARQATQNFEKYDHSRSFIAWLVGMARQRIAEACRKQGRSPLVFSSDVVESVISEYSFLQSQEDERLEGLRECMSKLSDRHLRVIELRYARRKPSMEIAKQVGCSTRAVTSMLQRIRSALKSCIERQMVEQQ